MLLAGSGSSRHAAEIAARWWRRWGLEAEAHPATELADREDPFAGERMAGGSAPALVAVTQSGATGSILRLLDQAAAAGVRRVAVTNEADSEAAKRADLTLATCAGSERAIPATKSFTAALAALRILGLDWAEATGTLPPERRRAADSETGAIPRALDPGPVWSGLAAEFAALSPEGPWFFLGEGSLGPLASEGALKMLEAAAVPALALPSGELAHGPRALLAPTTPVVVLSEGAEPAAGELRSLAAAREAGAPVVRCSVRAGRTDPAAGPVPVTLELPHTLGVWLAPFVAAPVLQWLALYAGVRRGRKVDAPEGLRKAVGDD